jgi:multidrug transporter EmrE-like cation transporter
MLYLWLILAIIFEAGWAIAMKLSVGMTRLWPTIAMMIMYILSVVFLSLATRRMDIGVAYAIWAGCGVSLIAVAGMMWFKEPVTAIKIASLALITLGIVGLQIAGSGSGAHAASSPIP